MLWWPVEAGSGLADVRDWRRWIIRVSCASSHREGAVEDTFCFRDHVEDAETVPGPRLIGPWKPGFSGALVALKKACAISCYENIAGAARNEDCVHFNSPGKCPEVSFFSRELKFWL